MWNDFTQQFWASTVDGLTNGSIYALIALGYTLVYGVLRLINFAHSEIFMLGTFAALGALNLFGISGPQTGLALVGTLLLMLVVAMVASGGSAVLLERIAYRPLRKRGASRLAALISAIGASFFLQELLAIWLGRRPDQNPAGDEQGHAVQHRIRPGTQRQGAGRGGRRRDDAAAGAVREHEPARPRHPGHGPGSRDRGADGREHRPGGDGDVPARRHPGRRRGRALRLVLRAHPVQRRLPPGHQGVHRGGARRHRQHPWRAGRRPGARD